MYERRESRHEDIDMINQLKGLVRDRENQMQKLIVSARVFLNVVAPTTYKLWNKVHHNRIQLDPPKKKQFKPTMISGPPNPPIINQITYNFKLNTFHKLLIEITYCPYVLYSWRVKI